MRPPCPRPVLLALAAAGVPSIAMAQRSDVCRLVEARNYLATSPGRDDERHFIQGPVHFTCGADVTLRADSAVLTPATGLHLLIGNVFYRDSVKTLTADRLTYLRPLDRLHATGDVELRDLRDGSILRGPDLEHHGVRGDPEPAAARTASSAATTRTIVRGGAHATIRPRDSDAAPAAADPAADSGAVPLDVDAERIEITGRERFYATGDVRLARGASRGFARRASYDRELGHLELEGAARIEDEAFDLLGERIDAYETGSGGELRYVHATGDAVLLGDEMRLRSPDIRVFFEAGELHRLVAARRDESVPATEAGAPSTAPAAPTAPIPSIAAADPAAPPARMEPPVSMAADEAAGRPRLDSPDLHLVADSLDVLAPAQRLERVTAIGDAYAERPADSLAAASKLPEYARRDWVRGDTIVGHFAVDTLPSDTAAPARGAGPDQPADVRDRTRTVLERVVASSADGRARSLYRMPADSTASARRRINYVIARRLLLSIRDGAIAALEADGPVRGIYSEPVVRPAADTTDVASPPPDTTNVASPPPDGPREPPADSPRGAS